LLLKGVERRRSLAERKRPRERLAEALKKHWAKKR
jgi:hypothetical protein